MKITWQVLLKKSVLHLLSWFCVWFFFKAFFSVGVNNREFVWLFSLIMSIITIVSTVVFMYYLIPNFLLKKKYGFFTLYTVYSLIIIAFFVSIVILIGFTFFYHLEYKKMPTITRSFPIILVCVYLFVALGSAFKILISNYKSLEENKALENKFLQTQLQLKEQELKFLKMQIHPHFLFNSLNTIYGFALKKKDEAPEMILKLSNLLDYILYQVDKQTVSIQDEMNHLEDYISLEKMRFHDTLNVVFQKKNINSDVQIAPMLLIPFLENSFKHGKIVDEKLEVVINLSIENNMLIFEIKNSSENEGNQRKGIGLKNIKKRLEMLYPNAHQFIVEDEKNQFRIQLQITIDSLKTKPND